MRVHVYSQELSGELKLIEKVADTGVPYHGVQFILHSSERLHHTEDDDDRSAVTFWLPRSAARREAMATLFERAARDCREAPPESGLD